MWNIVCVFTGMKAVGANARVSILINHKYCVRLAQPYKLKAI